VICRSCRWFVEHQRPRAADDPVSGDCRRYPPRPQFDEDDGGVYVLFPVVADDLWCGEFAQALH
jgi:hypothetical protein